jgi:anoctamin-10
MTTPPFVGIYSAISDKITSWEGHATQRAHDFSLLVKLLPINSIVAFYALILSAVVYIPYGDELMAFFHLTLFQQPPPPHDGNASEPSRVPGTWRRSVSQLPSTTPKTRLAEQMFSFTLVLQLFPIALEILMPFVVRFVTTRLTKNSSADAPQTKRIIRGGEKESSASKEDELVDTVVFESSLPPHRFFGEP